MGNRFKGEPRVISARVEAASLLIVLGLKVLNKRVTCIDLCATAELKTVGNTGKYRLI